MNRSPPEAATAEAAPADEGCDVTVAACITAAVRRYLSALDGHVAHDLHRLVIGEVERPLLAAVMEHCDGNLTAAAALLGLNRATVRRKLIQYGLARAADD
jgi:Fis family transcriptional regulator, factor for inversion stimulation protein